METKAIKPEKKLKTRFLLASMIFDIEKHGNNSMVANWVFDTKFPKLPLRLCFRYQWLDLEVGYPLNDRSKKIFEGRMIENTKILVNANIPKYDGSFDIRITDELYITENGKTLPFMGDFEAAKKYLTK
jgi:hypothetical protein